MGNNSDEPKDKTFTIDVDDTSGEMPGVTRLLNRKSMKGIGKAAEPAAPAAPSTPPVSTPEPHSNSRIELNIQEKSLGSIIASEIPPAAEPPPEQVSNSRIELNLQEKSVATLVRASPEASSAPSSPESEGIQIEGLESSATAAASRPDTPTPATSSLLESKASPFEIKIDTSGFSGDSPLELESSGPPQTTPQAPAPTPILAAPVTPPEPAAEAPAPIPASLASLLAPAAEEAPPAMIESQTQLVRVLRARPRKTSEVKPLILWDAGQLTSGKDPLGKGIVTAFKKGAHNALFLAIAPPPPGASIPIFLATAAVLPNEKLGLWTGLKWNPMLVPELWNIFVRAGIVELAPPGNLTNQLSNRNVIRSGFGIQNTEYLLLVRAGPPNGCRGVVAFVSKESILLKIDDALPLLYSAPATGAAPKAA